MPLYEFWCETCQTHFEAILARESLSTVLCPSCRSTEVERLISSFAAPSGKVSSSEASHACGGPACACAPQKATPSHCGVDWRS